MMRGPAGTMAVPIRERTGRRSPSRSCDALALDSDAARAGLHGCHLEPAVRLDAVYAAADGFAAREPCSNPDYVFAPHRRPDVSFPLSGVPRGQVRAQGTAVAWRRTDRTELGARCSRVHTRRSLPHLWAPRS